MAIQTTVDDDSSDLQACSSESQTLQVGDTTVEIRETDDGFEAVEINPYSRRYRFFDPIVGAIEASIERFMIEGGSEEPRLTYGQSGIVRLLTGIPLVCGAMIAIMFCMVLWVVSVLVGWLVVPKDEFYHLGEDSEPSDSRSESGRCKTRHGESEP